MEKKTIILNTTITVEVDERVEQCDSLGDAIKLGYAVIINADVNLTTNNGDVCDDEGVLNQAKQAIIWGLTERA